MAWIVNTGTLSGLGGARRRWAGDDVERLQSSSKIVTRRGWQDPQNHMIKSEARYLQRETAHFSWKGAKLGQDGATFNHETTTHVHGLLLVILNPVSSYK